jgi:hypothetical protein
MEHLVTNKEKRYEMYAFAAKRLFGRLGRGVRKMIPHCVTSEIHGHDVSQG